MEEVLSILLWRNFENALVNFIILLCPSVLSFFYANDLLVSTNGDDQCLRRIMKIFALYESWLGYLMNKEKLAIFMSKHISLAR